jgi:hypothetical protein
MQNSKQDPNAENAEKARALGAYFEGPDGLAFLDLERLNTEGIPVVV